METFLEKIEKGINTGVIIGPDVIRETDFMAGAETGIRYEVRIESGDWEEYKPTDERQSRITQVVVYDSLSCVTFSALNIVETQLNWMLAMGLIPADVEVRCRELGYIDENNKFNFSDWFTAVMSETSPQYGNTLQRVWDSIRNDGLLPQKDGHELADFNTVQEWVDKSRVTQAQKDKALLSKELFEILYEWVVLNQPGRWDLFEYHSKQAPLHIATPTCASWNTFPPAVITQCGDYKTLNHATAYIGQKKDDFHKDLDHYNPFVKHLAWDYYIPYAIKAVVTLKKVTTPKPFSYEFEKSLRAGAKESTEVKMLQTALQTLKRADGSTYMKVGVFGPYGPQTKKAVGLFQTDNKITDPDGQGTNFGPKTREKMNAALKALQVN